MGGNSEPRKRGLLWHLNRSAKSIRSVPDKIEKVEPKPFVLKPIKCGCMSCVSLRKEETDGNKG